MSVSPLKVLIVDDSRIFRGVIEEALAGRPDIRVVGSVWTGEKAVEFARTSLPDFVTLDIEMPGMGGIETLKSLRELAAQQQRKIGVLLVSSYTQRGAKVTMEGLQEGAFDFVTKPDGPDARENAAVLQQQLLLKIEAFRSRRPVSPMPMPPVQRKPLTNAPRQCRFRAIVIASSTGGPEALTRLLPTFAPVCPLPMYLVQHLPAGFSSYFASSLSSRIGIRVSEAVEGSPAQPGQLWVAPGGKHMLLNMVKGQVVASLSDSPPENGCRPAADVLFRSAAVAYAGQVLSVVLTGMGCDGAKGAAALKRAGGYVIAQDEATSVVWGMPGSTVQAGAAHEVLPIHEIGPAILSQLGIGG